MNLLILLFLSLVLTGFGLMALVFRFFLRKRRHADESTFARATYNKPGHGHGRCTCGRGGNCSIE